MSLLQVPSATYRIQFSLVFRFVDARELVPYLHELGVTDLYASPQFRARRGSSHGYDVADPSKVNSELGTDEEFEELEQRLKHYNMGLLLDIVPNHMAASSDTPWWMDVLENGRSSEYADFFDINWPPPTRESSALREHKILLPILGDLYGNVLENQEFTLKLDETGFFVRYFDQKLPLDPRTYAPILEYCLEAVTASLGAEHAAHLNLINLLDEARKMPDRTEADPQGIERRRKSCGIIKQGIWKLHHESEGTRRVLDQTLAHFNGIKGEPRSFDHLHEILTRQAYRVAYWKLAAEEINYRRFFDVSDLIGVRVEDPKVFQARHALIFRLIQAGRVTGLRIDHTDGLRDPQDYLRQIQNRASASKTSRSKDPGFYVIVEKILADGEILPEEWPIAGTTGYEFLKAVNGLFIDASGLKTLGEVYRKFTGVETDFAEATYEGNKKVLADLFAGEMNSFAQELDKLAADDRHACDVPLSEHTRALVEVTACLPVYRTYIRGPEIAARDRRYLEAALKEAERRTPEEAAGPPAFAFLRRVLLLDLPAHEGKLREQWLRFVMRWQQFTGAAMAKGLEDTALYVYNRLTSMNDVGGNPGGCGVSLEDFHAFLQSRRKQMPHTLNATSTHDTKRSEDVRARLNVLSELADEWRKRLTRWSKWNYPQKRMVEGQPAPDRNDEVLLYQTLLGAWPLDEHEIPAFRERMRQYLLKAAREAKVHTSWNHNRQEYEDTLLNFTDSILLSVDSERFLKDLKAFGKTIAFFGALNSLSQLLLKVCSPGVPDFYQGTELWDFSLVDPDNRRPVDFQHRIRQLENLRHAESQGILPLARQLLEAWRDGRLKLFVTHKSMNFRRSNKGLFLDGDYLPLEVTGSHKNHVCGFARRRGGDWAIVVVPRLMSSLVNPGEFPVGRGVWHKGTLILPSRAPGGWRNIFTDQVLKVRQEGGKKILSLSQIFRDFPIALLSPARISPASR
jgi:(1->4)-alpha-D-glucan 1-alpha-D-glucosylmutase